MTRKGLLATGIVLVGVILVCTVLQYAFVTDNPANAATASLGFIDQGISGALNTTGPSRGPIEPSPLEFLSTVCFLSVWRPAIMFCAGALIAIALGFALHLHGPKTLRLAIAGVAILLIVVYAGLIALTADASWISSAWAPLARVALSASGVMNLIPYHAWPFLIPGACLGLSLSMGAAREQH